MPKPLRARPPETPSAVKVFASRTKSRHQFSAANMQRVLAAAALCVHGELGGLLRQEVIHHSQLQIWRAQQAASGAVGLRPQRPGPTPKHDLKDRQIQALNKQVTKLERELVMVNGLVELRKKLQAMFSAMQEGESPRTP